MRLRRWRATRTAASDRVARSFCDVSTSAREYRMCAGMNRGPARFQPCPAMRPRHLCALALALLATVGCARRGSVDPKAPIILISIDTLRSDHLPAYGYTKVDTPAIDAFRKDSILFEHAYSQCPLTLVSHASVFTGLLPAE